MKIDKDIENKIREILLKNDPLNIYFDEDQNVDEYDSEIEKILDILSICKYPSGHPRPVSI
jgi:hypothetical protein